MFVNLFYVKNKNKKVVEKYYFMLLKLCIESCFSQTKDCTMSLFWLWLRTFLCHKIP